MSIFSVYKCIFFIPIFFNYYLQTVMERVSRLTMADIIPSIDSLINQPVLGTCYKFKTDIYRFHDGRVYIHVFQKVILCLEALNVNIGPCSLLQKIF